MCSTLVTPPTATPLHTVRGARCAVRGAQCAARGARYAKVALLGHRNNYFFVYISTQFSALKAFPTPSSRELCV